MGNMKISFISSMKRTFHMPQVGELAGGDREGGGNFIFPLIGSDTVAYQIDISILPSLLPF